jgi:hypothetical protein
MFNFRYKIILFKAGSLLASCKNKWRLRSINIMTIVNCCSATRKIKAPQQAGHRTFETPIITSFTLYNIENLTATKEPPCAKVNRANVRLTTPPCVRILSLQTGRILWNCLRNFEGIGIATLNATNLYKASMKSVEISTEFCCCYQHFISLHCTYLAAIHSHELYASRNTSTSGFHWAHALWSPNVLERLHIYTTAQNLLE